MMNRKVLHTVNEKLEEIRTMLQASIKTDKNLLLETQPQQIKKEKIT